MDILNRVMMIGNLTEDPTVRETGSGTAVAHVCVAVDAPGGGKQGGSAASDDPVFVDVTLWERNAENAGRFLRKGSGVLVEGRLRMDRWQDRQSGQNRSKLCVVGERIRFLNLGGSAADDGAPSRGDSAADARSGDRRSGARENSRRAAAAADA